MTYEWDEGEALAYGRFRSAVARSIRGKRGQEFLRRVLEKPMDYLKKGLRTVPYNPDLIEEFAKQENISEALAFEFADISEYKYMGETDQKRVQLLVDWSNSNLKKVN